jgi:1-acyl-sn-glycerol-3-phosphate acyltransferase
MGSDKARRSRSWRWLHGARDPHWGTTLEGYDAASVERAKGWLERLFGRDGHYPVQVSGMNELPADPALFVSNHSGGSTVLDCVGLAFAWYDHFGRSRPLHFLAHEILLATKLTGPFFHKVGVLRASRHLAHQALGEWRRDVAVMPGGDQDTWRPWKDRYRVRFAGHTGYARVALKSGVPIVPVAHAGPHDTFMVLTDGRRIAKRLRLHDLFRIDVFPIHLSLPWGLGIGPWPHIPLPQALRYRFGQPVQPPELVPAGAEPSDVLVREYDRMVREAMQRLLDELAAEDPLGRPGTQRPRVGRRRRPREQLVVDEAVLEDALAAAE